MPAPPRGGGARRGRAGLGRRERRSCPPLHARAGGGPAARGAASSVPVRLLPGARGPTGPRGELSPPLSRGTSALPRPAPSPGGDSPPSRPASAASTLVREPQGRGPGAAACVPPPGDWCLLRKTRLSLPRALRPSGASPLKEFRLSRPKWPETQRADTGWVSGRPHRFTEFFFKCIFFAERLPPLAPLLGRGRHGEASAESQVASPACLSHGDRGMWQAALGGSGLE